MIENEEPATLCVELSLKQLFDRYYTRLVHFSAQITGSTQAAEDVVQEAFIKYWNQQSDVTPHPLAVKSYLYTAVKHASLNFVRHQKVKAGYAVDFDDTAVEDSLESAIIHAEVLAELHRALSTLPAVCQQVSRMCYLNGMKNQEVAQELGISVNSVKTHKQRALQLLRLQLRPELFALVVFLN
ncbi:RNA polymerase sigma-70 factor [Pontibacter korlensis]